MISWWWSSISLTNSLSQSTCLSAQQTLLPTKYMCHWLLWIPSNCLMLHTCNIDQWALFFMAADSYVFHFTAYFIKTVQLCCFISPWHLYKLSFKACFVLEPHMMPPASIESSFYLFPITHSTWTLLIFGWQQRPKYVNYCHYVVKRMF